MATTKVSVSLRLDFVQIMDEQVATKGITREDWLEACWRLAEHSHYLTDELEGRHAGLPQARCQRSG